MPALLTITSLEEEEEEGRGRHYPKEEKRHSPRILSLAASHAAPGKPSLDLEQHLSRRQSRCPGCSVAGTGGCAARCTRTAVIKHTAEAPLANWWLKEKKSRG